MTESTPIRRVAVRGDDDVAETLAATDLEVVELDTAQAVVTVGEEALVGAALSGPSVPLVPVGVAEGHHGVSIRDLDTAAAAIHEGRYRAVSHPTLSIDIGGEQVGRAVFDVSLMTSEPARISEYALTIEGEALWSVRADGVVVSTSLGSAGYGRAAGGPIVAAGSGLSVVPVSPFATRADSWVVDAPLDLSIQRDEGDVSLFADDEELQTLGREHPVRVSVASEFDYLRPVVE